LIEDDLDLRESLRDLLEMEGYGVEHASDGADALEKLKVRTGMPDLILLDWMMPRMDGAQFCVAKKPFPHIDAVPIVLLTADGRLNEKVTQIGAAMGIAKPVDVDVLLNAIERLVV
jgi:DNA-binding response OmpR family regulator